MDDDPSQTQHQMPPPSHEQEPEAEQSESGDDPPGIHAAGRLTEDGEIQPGENNQQQRRRKADRSDS